MLYIHSFKKAFLFYNLRDSMLDTKDTNKLTSPCFQEA